MEGFEKYLNEKGYRNSTIKDYLTTLAILCYWCSTNALSAERITYNELLKFIDYCTSRGNTRHTINGKLNGIHHYLSYLQESKIRTDNPAQTLRLKNVVKRIPNNIITYQELERIYNDYNKGGITGKRNKCILGIIVYQGAKTGEISSLETKDLQLEHGQIYIPGHSRSNSRILKLDATQIISLQNYVNQVRPSLLAMNGQSSSNQLFMSSGQGGELYNTFKNLLATLKKHNPQIQSFEQLRSSVISHWIKQTNLREAQYRAGHKYVSSTERYKTETQESLLAELEKYDPMKD